MIFAPISTTVRNISFVILLLFLANHTASKFVNANEADSHLELPGRRTHNSTRTLSVLDFGARGNGVANDAQAFQNAWKFACSLPGQAKLIIPRGYEFLLHPVDFAGSCKSRLSLDISGTIVAPEDPEIWEGLNPRKWIYFHGVRRLTVEGDGRIDGRGHTWWERSCKINKTMKCHHAPTAITFHKCTDLIIKKVEIVNGQQMHLAFTNCVRVTVAQLILSAPALSPNTDGIHLSSSQHVKIVDSSVQTGDDCVSVVGNSSHISIANFTCVHGHGISIGSIGQSDAAEIVKHVVVDGAFLSQTKNGLRIKTWQGGKGEVFDIKYKNIEVENVSHPIIIEQYYCDSAHDCDNQTSGVSIENISYMHIKGSSATMESVRFACSDAMPCEGIYLEDVRLVSRRGGKTRAFCWQVHGSSHGFVSPPPCFPCSDVFLPLVRLPSDALQYI